MRLRTAVPMLMLLLLCACGAANQGAQTPIELRTALTEAGGCGFTLDLKADYGDYIRTFRLSCRSTAEETTLVIEEPEIVQGITATVRGADAQVSYEDTVLAVEDFQSRRISPMAAPELLAQAWREGYIRATGMDGDREQVCYLLGYGGSELEIVTWFDGPLPCRAEIDDGQQVLISCEITDFTLQNQKDEEHEITETDLGGG